MQSKSKSNSVCTSKFDATANTLTITVLGAGSAVLNLGATSAACNHAAMVRGYNQRLINMAALPHDKTTGKKATAEEKFAPVKRAVDHYNTGTSVWAIAADDTYDTGLVVQAMIRAKVATDAEVANDYANRYAKAKNIDRAAALKIWATVGPVAEAIATIKTERAVEAAKHANLDVQSMMDEMNMGEESDGSDAADEPSGDTA